MYNHGRAKVKIVCIYKGLTDKGEPILIQDKRSQISDLYEEGTVHSFTYLRSKIKFSNEGEEYEIHIFKDSFGLTHSFNGELLEHPKTPGAQVPLYVKGITKNGNLSLCIDDPTKERVNREWYDASRVFSEIDELNNKNELFDDICHHSNSGT